MPEPVLCYAPRSATARFVAMLDKKLLALLVCPVTKAPLHYVEAAQELWSAAAGLAFPVRDGIPVLLEDQARPLEAAEIEQLRQRR